MMLRCNKPKSSPSPCLFSLERQAELRNTEKKKTKSFYRHLLTSREIYYSITCNSYAKKNSHRKQSFNNGIFFLKLNELVEAFAKFDTNRLFSILQSAI